MFDITLYGHLAIDTIHDGDKKTMSLGAMANMARTFKDIDANISLGLCPTAIGEADIYIDRKESTRDSIANLNRYEYDSPIKPSHISHILYINQLTNTDFISKLDGIVTADTCKGPKVDVELLKYVDYLFVSYEELHDLDELAEHTKGAVIIHTSVGSTVRINGEKKAFFIDPSMFVKDANVLGAGDMFASCFLYDLLKSGSMESAIGYAHKTASELIRKYNEKV
jgi:sugar/nucleoside kinase (ribokinase family)